MDRNAKPKKIFWTYSACVAILLDTQRRHTGPYSTQCSKNICVTRQTDEDTLVWPFACVTMYMYNIHLCAYNKMFTDEGVLVCSDTYT